MRASTIAYYKSVADRLGLDIKPSNWGPWGILIAGNCEGVQVSAQRLSASQSICRALIHPPAHLGLAITPSGVLSKLASIFGAEDLQIGDPEFDKAFTIHGHDAATIAALLTPAVRDKLWALQRAHLSFALTDLHVQIRRHITMEEEDIESDLRALVDLVHAVNASLRALPVKEAPQS
jgi:hypothetical protein